MQIKAQKLKLFYIPKTFYVLWRGFEAANLCFYGECFDHCVCGRSSSDPNQSKRKGEMWREI
jgi:hypothetical protein